MVLAQSARDNGKGRSRLRMTMTQPSRFNFSLLRLMLSIAGVGVVLAIGRWSEAAVAPMLVAAATAGALMFVIQWRNVPCFSSKGPAHWWVSASPGFS